MAQIKALCEILSNVLTLGFRLWNGSDLKGASELEWEISVTEGGDPIRSGPGPLCLSPRDL